MAARLDAANERLMNQLNADGRIFLSHTRIDGRFSLRIAIGNIRTERRHVELAWRLVHDAASDLEVEADGAAATDLAARRPGGR